MGVLLALDGYHVFRCRPSYLKIAGLPLRDRAAAMRDPACRARILGEANVAVEAAPSARVLALAEYYAGILDRFYALRPPADYEPDESSRLSSIAAQTGQSLEEVVYDLYAESEGGDMIANFIMNYADGDLDAVGEMLAHPATVSGLGDGGAHLQMICDASMTTYHLSYWARDRVRGPLLPLELMVHKLSGKLADLYGLHDRGVIEVGRRADINVIDFDRLGAGMPHMVFDLPQGSARLLQQSSGYVATLVNGVLTRRDGEETGARPGRLLRLAF